MTLGVVTKDSHRILSSPRIPEDDLPGLADSGLRQAGIGQAPVSHLPRFVDAVRWLTGAWPNPACRKPESARPGKSSSGIRWSRKVILPNLQIGFDEASCLKSSSWNTRFRLVVSRNRPDSGKSSSGDWKIAESDFGWTKSSQKSLSRTN
jgi:hypothetical protein